MRELYQVFLNAVMFFTRLPVPAIYSPQRLNRAAAFFPLVGWLVGGTAAGAYLLAARVLPTHVAVWLSTAATIWMTGAFHEDGWADFCDGFGGGYGRDRILEIMKDSRIGTYGTVGLVLMLGAKAMALAALPPALIAPALVAGHALSRAASGTLIRFGSYAQADRASKAKPLATSMSARGLALALLTGLLPLALLPPATAWAVPLCLAVAAGMYAYCRRHIGGYTGDCLGAVQQLAEVAAYLLWAALLT